MNTSFQIDVTVRGVEFHVTGTIYRGSPSTDYDQPDDPTEVEIHYIHYADNKNLNVIEVTPILDAFGGFDAVFDAVNVALSK